MLLPSILIVDDERNIREGLLVMVQRVYAASIPDEPITITSAPGGKEALQLLRNRDIDLMITDIRMPEMNGIALMEEARRINTDLYIVVLSGFGEFQAARLAIEQGARSYLLKPVDRDELTETLLSATANIRTTRSQWEHRMATLLLPGITGMPEVRFPDHLSLFLPGRITIFSEAHNAQGNTGNATSVPSELIDEIRQIGGAVIVGYITVPHLVVICRDEENVSAVNDHFLDRTDGLAVAIGPPVRDLAGLLGAYRRTIDAMTRALLAGSNRHVFQVEQDYDPIVETRDLDWIRRLVQSAFDRHSTDPLGKLNEIIAEGTDHLGVTERSPFFAARALGTEVIRSAPTGVTRDALRSSPILQRLSNATGYRSSAEFIADIGALLLQLRELCETSDTEIDTRAAKKIRSVVEWIDHHYNDPNLSMAAAAEIAEMGYSYFSKRFSEVTGYSFVRFVQDKRIEAAKRLLLETDDTISQIAGSVGFVDKKKFSRLFRARVGVVPIDYRRSAGRTSKQ